MSVTAARLVAWGRIRNTSGRIGWYVPIGLAGLIALRFGVTTAGFVGVALIAAVGLVRVPGWAWVGAALGSALLSRIITNSGLLPGIVNFADFGLVYFGLLTIPFRRKVQLRHGDSVRPIAMALLMLLAAVWVSWFLHMQEPIRPVVTFALWAEPFALILIMLLDPPPENRQRTLLGLFAFLVAIQVPYALAQHAQSTDTDLVRGTLLGAGAGAHVMSGIAALGGLALLAWGFGRSISAGILAAVLAFPILVYLPMISDAKQVIFALPLALIVLWSCGPHRARRVGMLVPGALALFAVLVFGAGNTAVGFLSETGPTTGKALAANAILREVDGSLSGYAFGVGPANSVSRAAFITMPGYLNSSLALGLAPAPIARDVVGPAAAAGDVGSSFQWPLSSALGILGDVGVIGFITYVLVVMQVWRPLVRNRRDWMAGAALAGWALSIPLAIAFEWWEQPPFMLPLALLTGLAILRAEKQGIANDQVAVS